VIPPAPGRVTSTDGIVIATAEWTHGDAAPPIVMVHATGFCKEVAAPVVEELAAGVDAFRVVALDQRGHGDSTIPEPPYDWWDIGRDVLAVIGDSRGVVGVGHSSGAAAIMLAELLSPGSFRSMVLVEPVVFPPPYGSYPDNPMSVAARRRRASFSSPDEALQRWQRRAPFSAWDRRALDAYVGGGLVWRDGSWVLKCPPEVEAEFYVGAMLHEGWERLGEIATPALLVAGEHSPTHPEVFLRATAKRMQSASYVIVPGASHFVWMERPAAVAAHVAEML